MPSKHISLQTGWSKSMVLLTMHTAHGLMSDRKCYW